MRSNFNKRGKSGGSVSHSKNGEFPNQTRLFYIGKRGTTTTKISEQEQVNKSHSSFQNDMQIQQSPWTPAMSGVELIQNPSNHSPPNAYMNGKSQLTKQFLVPKSASHTVTSKIGSYVQGYKSQAEQKAFEYVQKDEVLNQNDKRQMF